MHDRYREAGVATGAAGGGDGRDDSNDDDDGHDDAAGDNNVNGHDADTRRASTETVRQRANERARL